MIVIQNLKMHRGSKIKNVFKYFDVNLDMGIVEKVQDRGKITKIIGKFIVKHQISIAVCSN